jgi:inositol-pentakisphosphate 2-kinase
MLVADEWHYKREGAQNMIFEYKGTGETPQFLDSVLRLSKNSRKLGANMSQGPKTRSCERNYSFLRDSIRPKIRHDLLVIGELLSVSQGFLQELNDKSMPLRPLNRLESGLNITAGMGWLLPDLSFLPGVSHKAANCACIEIKPKCGILPTPDCLSSETLIKAKSSRFQMMQSLKLREGKISSKSHYDPIDLFSGIPERMERAIQELVAEPQNNFRVCINQKECISHTADFNSSRSMNQITTAFGSIRTISDFAKLLVSILISSQVLVEIRRLQQLDRFDIENVYLIARHLENPQAFPSSRVRQQAPCKQLPSVRFIFYFMWDSSLTSTHAGG